MEELNNEIMDMVFELQSMHARQKVDAARLGDKDKYGFPFEPFETFSTEPLGFQETAMRLQTESVELYTLMRQVNRHSPLYYQMSSQLEKLLNQLGSACITKAVLEQQGQEFHFLDRLTIDSLREKTAFNFRKCYASYMESITTLNYNAEALGLSIRWAALDKRLIATVEKIELIKAGKVKVEVKNPAEKLNKMGGLFPWIRPNCADWHRLIPFKPTCLNSRRDPKLLFSRKISCLTQPSNRLSKHSTSQQNRQKELLRKSSFPKMRRPKKLIPMKKVSSAAMKMTKTSPMSLKTWSAGCPPSGTIPT